MAQRPNCTPTTRKTLRKAHSTKMTKQTHKRQTPQVIANRQRQDKALELRKAGATYNQIATQLGYSSPSTAHRAVTTALNRLCTDNAEQLLKLELTRLDQATLWAAQRAKAGEPAAINTLVRISERRAKLLGLDNNEKRLADAAEQQATIDKQQANLVIKLIKSVTTALGCTEEQQNKLPEILHQQMIELGLINNTKETR